MKLLIVAFNLHFLTTNFSFGVSTGGYYFVSNACYQNSITLSASKIEFKGMGALECGRLCTIHDGCKACHMFTHSVTRENMCYLYTNNLCNTDIVMYQDSTVINGILWDKISGDNFNNISTCRNEADCTIMASILTTIPIPATSTHGLSTMGTDINTDPANSTANSDTASIGTLMNAIQTNTSFSKLTINSVDVLTTTSSSAPFTPSIQSTMMGGQASPLPSNAPMITFNSNGTTVNSTGTLPPPQPNITMSGNTTNEYITGSAIISPTSAQMAPTSTSSVPPSSMSTGTVVESSTSSSTTPTTPASTASTSATSASTANLGEPRPRTCWDYYVQNGINDTDYGTPRTIWPTGYSSGPNITAHCRNGYTGIIVNYAVVPFFYDNKNDVTVFGSAGRVIPTTDPAGWRTYTSSINFPILSDLVRSSNRTLYYEQARDGLSPSSIIIYSGLDIAPDGSMSVQGPFKIVQGTPSNGFPTPLINSSFVNSTCGSFWKIPANSTDICTQTTNMLLLAHYQKIGSNSLRFVCLAFK